MCTPAGAVSLRPAPAALVAKPVPENKSSSNSFKVPIASAGRFGGTFAVYMYQSAKTHTTITITLHLTLTLTVTLTLTITHTHNVMNAPH